MDRAFICRYGHQSLRLLYSGPLSTLDLKVFQACLMEHFEAEVRSRDPLDSTKPGDD